MVLEGSEERKIICNKNEPKKFKNGKQLTLETATNPRDGHPLIFGKKFQTSKDLN